MEYVEFGKIINTHGIKGEVKIYPYTSDFDLAIKLKKIYIGNSSLLETKDKEKINLKSIKVHKNMFIAMLENIDTMDKAEKLKNKYVFKEIDGAEKLEEGVYYVKDLIGLEVYLEDKKHFGILTDVITTGANDVYIVATKSHGDVLIPAITDVVKKIDLSSKKIYISLMEGLI